MPEWFLLIRWHFSSGISYDQQLDSISFKNPLPSGFSMNRFPNSHCRLTWVHFSICSTMLVTTPDSDCILHSSAHTQHWVDRTLNFGHDRWLLSCLFAVCSNAVWPQMWEKPFFSEGGKWETDQIMSTHHLPPNDHCTPAKSMTRPSWYCGQDIARQQPWNRQWRTHECRRIRWCSWQLFEGSENILELLVNLELHCTRAALQDTIR